MNAMNSDTNMTNSISVKTNSDRLQEDQLRKISLPFVANLVLSRNDVLVGSVTIIHLFEFLKSYKNETGDIDSIYEKNVRLFLGSKEKVNIGIAKTLNENPEDFGLFNNGIAIVVDDFRKREIDQYELTEPCIVNGCQTIRTIWETLNAKWESGGTAQDSQRFLEQLSHGIVVVKIVKVGSGAIAEDKRIAITRYANSQDGLSVKDFMTLEDRFKNLVRQIEENYRVFLEIHAGSWERHKSLHHFTSNDFINLFELLKVYTSAWLGEPGLAFGTNLPFFPGGTIFERIIKDEHFNSDHFYAAYCLSKAVEKVNPATLPECSRFLHYYILVEFLRKILYRSDRVKVNDKKITKSIIKLFDTHKQQGAAAELLLETSRLFVNDYFDKNGENSLFQEQTFNGDMNAYLEAYHISIQNDLTLQELFQIHWDNLQYKPETRLSRLEKIMVGLWW